MDENNNSFFDKNTILAIGISLLFFMGWQTYMQNKYPDAYKVSVERTKSETVVDETGEAKNNDKLAMVDSSDSRLDGESKEDNKPVPKALAEENVFEIKNDSWSFKFTSEGMGFRNIDLQKYSDREEKNISFNDPKKQTVLFGTYRSGHPLNFKVEKKSDNHFVGTAKLRRQTLFKEVVLNPKNYTIAVTLKTLSGEVFNKETIETKLANKVLDVKGSMFTPAYEGTEFFTINDGSEERERINIDDLYAESFSKMALTSIGSQYFAVALNDSSSIIPKVELSFEPESKVAYATVSHTPKENGQSGAMFDVKYTGFVGPKKYDVLKELEPNFVKMINYGVFSFLSKPMLSMLKWLYGIFKNWGLAIIFLTILIRMLLLPINLSSMKSMKKMQKIQPKLKAIKEKYKSDPTRMNQETMALMKKEGANPLGGCLPMLLQLPVFFALYSVLGQSVELYKSPFMFWIQDLSFKDPFFVLPVAVGALYFIQMSITPQPTDPAQAKVMKFIPILFCFFMITVPSGLTLYFFVNTVFGIGQSFLIQREKRKVAA